MTSAVSSGSSRLRRGFVPVLVIVAALGWAQALHSTRLTAIDYWVFDQQSIGVLVLGGPAESCSVAKVVESPSNVQIWTECRGPLLTLGSSAVGIPFSYGVALEAELGNRVVLDGMGNPATNCGIPLCRAPG